MTVKQAIIRFTLIYLLMLVGIGIVFAIFNLPGNSAIGILVLMMSLMLVAESFARKNGRYFDDRERRQVTIGFIGVSLAAQMLFGWMALLDEDLALDGGVLATVLVFVGLIHVAAVVLGIRLTRRRLVKMGVIDN